MSTDHRGGNIQPGLDLEEHQGEINAKRVSLVSAPTTYAITSFSGNVTVAMPGGVTVFQGTSPWVSSVQGNVTLSDSKTFIGLTTSTLGASPAYIGLATIDIGTNNSVAVKGNVTLSDSKGYIGLVTATVGNSVGISGNVTLSDSKNFIGLVTLGGGTAWTDPKTFIGLTTVNIGSSNTVVLGAGAALAGIVTIANSNVRSITGNVTLSDAKTNIGLVTLSGGTAWTDPKAFIGLVTIGGMSTVTLSDPKGFIGLVTTQAADPKGYIGLVTVTQASSARTITGNVTLSDAKTFIGLVTIGGMSTVTLADPKGFIGLVTLGGGTAWADPKTFIGLVTVGNTPNVSVVGNVTLSDSKNFIGLVTAWSRNAGTTKTLKPFTVTLSTSSVTTIYVPTNTFYVTNLLLNSDATVRVSVKSGATYLTGNASIGITLNPNGGWVETGAPDSPTYIGLAAAAALVVEKADSGGLKANIGGKVILFEE